MGPSGRGLRPRRVPALVYSHAMATAAIPVKSRGLAQILAWRRVRFVLIVCALFGVLLNIGNQAPAIIVFARVIIVGMAILFMFGLFEQWPQRLWRPFSRWGWQLIGIVIVIPFAALFAYWITTGGDPQLDTNKLRHDGLRAAVHDGVAVRAVDCGRRGDSSTRSFRARPGAGVRAGEERAGAQVAGHAVATAAGAGRAALPVQHARERAGAGRRGLAAGVERAQESDRVSARSGAAHAGRSGPHSVRSSTWCVRTWS